MVQIEPSATKRMALKGFMVMAEKIWGYPMLFAASQEEALDIASRLLAGQPVASHTISDNDFKSQDRNLNKE